VIEVSDHTVAKDRGIKLMAYAGAGIPEYWIINLIDRQIEQYLQPQPDGTYAELHIHTEDSMFDCRLINQIQVSTFLP
ncbi:MAG: Uma2 family endonuclease, partial [Lewinella sp.]|nr:Uma2 family endonuclease [Lewinella sp.]